MRHPVHSTVGNVGVGSCVEPACQSHARFSDARRLFRWVAWQALILVHVFRKLGFPVWGVITQARQYISRNSSSRQNNVRLFNDRCDAVFGALMPESPVIPFTTNVPTVICLARNEEYRIGAFIDHYVRLGVRSIHIIVNNSTDRTAQIAGACPYVTVWRADGSYLEAEHGNLWRGALSRRFGVGKWILNLDADEFIVYSNMDKRGLPQLQEWMEARAKTFLCMPVIDMYPERINSADATAGTCPTLMHLIEESPYFDRPRTGLLSTCCIQKGHRGIELKGGVRLRMMHDLLVTESPWVNVFPLIKWTDDTGYCDGSRHSMFPPQSNDELFYAGLLHFKFVGTFAEKIREAVRDNQYWNNSAEYRRYADWLSHNHNHSLVDSDYSVKFVGTHSVLNERLLQAIDWDRPRPCETA